MKLPLILPILFPGIVGKSPQTSTPVGSNSVTSSSGQSDKFAEGPVAYEDTQPSVEIRLSPPKHPLPELSSLISQLDQKRKMIQERQTTLLLKAFDDELVRSRKLITSLIRKAFEVFDDPLLASKTPSFFEIPDDRNRPGKLWVSVEASSPVDSAALKLTEIIEQKNEKLATLLYRSATDDMHEVTRRTLQALNETLLNTVHPLIRTSFISLKEANQRCNELRARFGDLMQCDSDMNGTDIRPKQGPHEHLISVFAERDLYPTVESLVRDMLDRREIDVKLFRARSLALMARLAQKQSEIASQLLESSVSTMSVVFSDLIHATNMTRDASREFQDRNLTMERRNFLGWPQRVNQ